MGAGSLFLNTLNIYKIDITGNLVLVLNAPLGCEEEETIGAMASEEPYLWIISDRDDRFYKLDNSCNIVDFFELGTSLSLVDHLFHSRKPPPLGVVRVQRLCQLNRQGS